MAYVRKIKIKGKYYFSLVKKVKRDNGTFGLKCLKSFGTIRPTQEQINEVSLNPVYIHEKINSSDPDLLRRKNMIINIKPIEHETGSIWDATAKRQSEYYGK